MCFHLEGRTLPDGSFFKAEEEYAMIDAALEAARVRMSYGNTEVWIKDRRDSLVLSLQEVKERLKRKAAE